MDEKISIDGWIDRFQFYIVGIDHQTTHASYHQFCTGDFDRDIDALCIDTLQQNNEWGFINLGLRRADEDPFQTTLNLSQTDHSLLLSMVPLLS